MASSYEEIHVEITAPPLSTGDTDSAIIEDNSISDIYDAAAILMEAEQNDLPDFAAEAEIVEEEGKDGDADYSVSEESITVAPAALPTNVIIHDTEHVTTESNMEYVVEEDIVETAGRQLCVNTGRLFIVYL